MAGGLGTRLFVQGDVISAADVNGYLMNQSMMRFATTAARDTAFGNGIAVGSTVGGVAGDGKPLLQEGMFAYIDLNNDVTFYNGSQWVSAPTFVLADGEVTTVKIADDAVTSAKIADGAITSAHIADGTVIAADIADGSVTSAKILDGTIVNADINATAAIALSKLASGTSGQIVVHSSGGVPTATTVSGDVTIDSTGNVQIAADKIVDADINSSAAIAYSKLSLSGSITTTDLAAGAARAGFRSTGAGTAVTLTSNNYNILLADLGKLIEVGPTAANATVTMTSANDANFAVGDRVDVLQTTGTYVVTLQGSGVTINAYDAGLKLQGQWACATLIKRATNTWVAVGNLTT